MKRPLAVAMAGFVLCFGIRADAQKRITVEVFILEVQPDIAKQYALTSDNSFPPTKERLRLDEEFFLRLAQWGRRDRKVQLIGAAKVTTTDGQEGKSEELADIWYLEERKPDRVLILKSFATKEGVRLAVTPHVMEDGRIDVRASLYINRAMESTGLRSWIGRSGFEFPVVMDSGWTDRFTLENGKRFIRRAGSGGEYEPVQICVITATIEPDAPAKK